MAILRCGASELYTTTQAVTDAAKALGPYFENNTILYMDKTNFPQVDNNSFFISGTITNGFKLFVEVDPPAKGDGGSEDVQNSGARIINTFSGGLLTANNSDVIFRDLLFRNLHVSNDSGWISNNTLSVFERCVARCEPAARHVIRMGASGPIAPNSSLIIGGQQGIILDNVNATLFNATIRDCTGLAVENLKTITSGDGVQNVVTYNVGSGFGGVGGYGAGSKNNFSVDGSQPGTGGDTLIGNPFEINNRTPKANSQIDRAGVVVAGLTNDLSNTVFSIPPPAGCLNATVGGAIAPTGDAGGPYSGPQGSPTQLTGTVTPGTDGSPTQLWSVQSGGGGTFVGNTTLTPTFNPATINSSVLQMVISSNDSPDVTVTATFDVTVPGGNIAVLRRRRIQG